MTASGHLQPHARAAEGRTGRVEKMMRVRLLKDHTDGPLGVRMGVMDSGHWVLDLDGRPTGAAAAVILDNTLSASLRTTVDGLHWLVTTELHLNFLRRLPADGTVLEAWTRTLVGDEAGGMATGTLQGPDGTEYVHATGWFHGVEGNTPRGWTATRRRPGNRSVRRKGPPWVPCWPRGLRRRRCRVSARTSPGALCQVLVLPERTCCGIPAASSTAAH